VALFARAWIHYGEAGAPLAIQIARGCGACLNLNGALVLVPMLRHALTWVRRRPIGRILPVDSAVDLHRMIGETMFGLAIVHSLAHVANLALHAPPGFDWATSANVTGVVLLWVFSILWLMSRRRVRSSGHFGAFHFTHRALWWVWFLLLLAHGPVFWIWAGVPVLAFVAELVVRTQRAGMPSTIVEATAKASGVTHIRFKRPPGFREAPGDYVFVRVPAVSSHEWHPFTLTSAPESEHLSIHVRRLGDWTSALHERFLVGRDGAGLPIHVDGPYGTPAFHILDSEHVIAVAAGIGVTPFASVLESIRARARSGDVHMKLRRLHFVWLSREQESFEWFSSLLADLERHDTSDLFDIHIYVTGARDDLEGTSLELARALLHEQTGEDLVTGLRVRSRLGRPDISGLLDRFMAEPALPRPDVYFCGPMALARSLSRDCTARGLSFRQERF
jgi:predicted ferric reductase